MLKDNITALFMAWGNFTVIPCPYKRWDSKLNHRMLMFLPVIGFVIGFVWIMCITLLRMINCPALVTGAVSVFLLVRLCGYMHLDGFMDVSDAVMSRRTLEERQRILKDSRVGAFSVISLVFLLLLMFAAAGTLFSFDGSERIAGVLSIYYLPGMLLLPVFSRSCAGWMVLRYPPIQVSQYVEGSDDPYKGRYRVGLIVLMVLIVVIIGVANRNVYAMVVALWLGVAMWIAGALACWNARRQLGGMNGDIAGYTICVSELAGLMALAISMVAEEAAWF